MCYLKCWWAKMGVIKADGTVDYKKLINAIPENIRPPYASNIKACKDTVGSDVCETVFLFNKCLFQVKPQEYFYF
ncbi:PREDICTED: pheromone-binding protein-related protein 6-like [Nicrophorus vespilloides]|uniref:Pheromone-binding protein-related protein 6-like n=1 Tax=Nicrophorus vespilloides TaxID=110193 RepID=A0ABM1N448_NICVS|nr:PREDICTED: pheromone-binding protein-related protein 6-like [Nicrophorus vespilloides]